ncbi:hypothetical protein PIB30_042612 [Stylosanthes scabra]|uniref:Putative plant transposon protein domain-containing protein n=1 Tax=Stylosanthes scabra TaxID=79078 RepID=A0ABU6XEG6_9FABA|nr:hypothetical protein [Stylosanthes scabra]
MVKEFYANALEKEKRKPYTYTTMVRGKEISFAPKDIKKVLKLKKDPLLNTASYHERMANKDYRLDHVQEDLCIEGGEWVRHKDGRPHYLRRADREPMTKENINVEQIIANRFYKFIYKTDLSSSLPFPSIIAALCADAKIPAIKDDNLIPQEPPIVGETMIRVRKQEQGTQEQIKQGKSILLHKSNHNPKSTNNKISLQASTLILTPPCHRSIGGLTANKKKVGRVLRPSTQGWTAWMTS